ncbi:MAG TPA: type II toxin-antitoxin system VapC family toxin [Gemmataceae bacterium]|jgi:tRNA(fMet)-specific endonuclease VapC|nr:type II toxin-antitoxin system VapC family toxin [Gemmataceae bacterium]
MSLFVLDTDMLTLYQVGQAAVVQRVHDRAASEIAITVISVEEQLGGWYTQLRRVKKWSALAPVYERLANSVRSLKEMHILSFTESAIRRREDLVRGKVKIGKKDLAIAVIAMENNAVLVTRNRRDFQRIPGLQIEDWSQ